MKRNTTVIFSVLTGLLFLMYVLYGIYFNAIGANAESIMAFFRITEGQQGSIMTVQSVAAIALTIVLSLFGERMNKLYGLLAGLAVLGVAAAGIGIMPLYTTVGHGFGVYCAFILLGGFGLITLDLLMNGAVADLFPTRKETLLPVIHAFYGTGAMLSPLFVTWLANPAESVTFARPYLVLGCLAVAASIVSVIVMKKAMPQTPYADREALRARRSENPAEIFKDGRAWLMLIGCMLYSCCQIGLSAWLPQYALNVLHVEAELSNLMLTLYFLGALLSRFLSPLVYRKMAVKRFYGLSLLASVAAFLGFLFLPVPIWAKCIFVVLVGLLQGAAVPAQVILCCDLFPTRSASASSLVILGISFAGLLSPLVMGKLIERVGYGLPMGLLCICVVLSVAVLKLVDAISQRRSA